MSQDLEEAVDGISEPTDPITLARQFVTGRTLKRGATIQLVRDLLALLDAQGESTAWAAGIPNVAGYDAKPPIALHATAAGAVFLGRDANRYFTRTEAIALAGAIARAATGRNV